MALRTIFSAVVAVKYMKVIYFLLWCQCFSYERKNGERNCHGLLLMHVTVELVIILSLSLQEEHVF
jgi:hypothetical protein